MLEVSINGKDDETCIGCGVKLGRGEFLSPAEHGVRCLKCAHLDALVFLPSGDTALTVRARKLSSCSAEVLKFSTARKRWERQGVLVEPQALERAKKKCEADAAKRAAARAKRRAREQGAEERYVVAFTQDVLELFPGCPPEEAKAIAEHACEKYSGRVGRSASAKVRDAKAVELAVRAHVRHSHTDYDALVDRGSEKYDARAAVRDDIEAVLEQWRRSPSGKGKSSGRSRPEERRSEGRR